MTPLPQNKIMTESLLVHRLLDNGLTRDSIITVTSTQYPENDRHGAFIAMIQAISDELIDRYFGEPVSIYTLLENDRIKRHWQDFICHIRQSSFLSEEEKNSPFFTEQKIVEIIMDILCILVLKTIANLREDYVYETFLFRQMAQDCGLLFDDKGKYIGKDDKFCMFLQRHSALMQV